MGSSFRDLMTGHGIIMPYCIPRPRHLTTRRANVLIIINNIFFYSHSDDDDDDDDDYDGTPGTHHASNAFNSTTLAELLTQIHSHQILHSVTTTIAAAKTPAMCTLR
eukprot:1923642-Amphidinium_carterae.2